MLAWVLLPVVLAKLTGVTGQGLNETVSQSNVKGDVLVLDAASYSFRDRNATGPTISTPEACSARCKRTPGCNAYVFCNSTEGCGGGCKTHVRSHPKLGVIPETNTIPRDSHFPLLGFGPWTFPSVSDGCHSDTSDRWPFGLCTLKFVCNITTPEFWSNNTAEGWVSGLLITPSECANANVSYNACWNCMSGANKEGCLACATRGVQPAIEILLGEEAKEESCNKCFDPSRIADVATCQTCLSSNAPCGKCITNAVADTNISACVQCAITHGPGSEDMCWACAGLRAPEKIAQCEACIAAVRPNICPNSTLVTAKKGCIPPLNSGLCVDCLKAADPARCIQCASRKGLYADDCQKCALVPAPQQEQCYVCTEKAASPLSECADCLQFSTAPEPCVTCTSNPATVGKDACNACTSWFNETGTLQQCFTCLQQPSEDHIALCGRKPDTHNATSAATPAAAVPPTNMPAVPGVTGR